MKRPTLTPLDASWLVLLGHVDALYELAAMVRAAGPERARKGQREARARAASALAALSLDRWEHDGVRLTLTSAPTVLVGDELVIIGASRLVVRLDPGAVRAARLRAAMASPGGATIVDLLERRRARERVA